MLPLQHVAESFLASSERMVFVGSLRCSLACRRITPVLWNFFFSFFLIKKCLLLIFERERERERERQSTNREGPEREGDTESEAG